MQKTLGVGNKGRLIAKLIENSSNVNITFEMTDTNEKLNTNYNRIIFTNSMSFFELF